jgi:signal transduction histidine kinase/CheY-like chemotaxis protein
MKRPSNDRKISFAFLAAFALLAVVPLFVFENRGKLLDDSGWVAHTQEVIAGVESVNVALSDAESAQRGYLITGRVDYLDRYHASATTISDRLAELARLTTDNPAQQRRVEQLKPLVRQRVAKLKTVIDVRRARGYPAAAALVGTDQGRRLVAEIRVLLDAMRGEEQRLLGQRKETLQTSVGRGMTVFWAVTLLNFFTLAFSFYLVNRYITHRRRTEESLNEARRAAEAANIAKSAFLANMSHEIRTPMSAIVGYSDMLLEPGSTQSDKLDCLQTIRRNARHLLELINDVLDLSKIEAGRMTVERLSCDLPQLAGDVVSMMRPRAIEKGLEFKLTFAGAVPRRIETDPLRLKQILVNLVGNAIKFTETGSIELRVSSARQSDGRTKVTCDVVDTGIGVSPQQVERLFQPFSQADESTTRKFGGTGLGLTISQRLARVLGGTIDVRSQPLQGSTFTLTIDAGEVSADMMVTGVTEAVAAEPPVASPPPQQQQEQPQPLAGRILLAEDGLDNQRLISTYLRGAGAEVVIVENGRAAVDRALSQRFDAIVMDMQMPEMDGYAAAGELRRRGMRLPIIALTAHAMADDRAKCLDAGCTDYLTKPIARHDLIAAVRRHLPTDPSQPLRSSFGDEPDMREIIAQFVARLPEQVRELETLLAVGDWFALKRLIHQIKGSAGGYGFQTVTEAAARVEKRVLDAVPESDIAAGIRDLIELMSTVDGFVPISKGTDPSAREAA